MKFMDLVKNRQSCRQYAAQPVSREIIERCLEAARLAPSACNSQPWTFLVIHDPEKKNELAEKAFSGIYSMNRFAGQAPVLIVVVTERSKYVARLGGQLRGVQYSLIDVGIACEHLILQAAEEGLGTCWLGWFNEKAVKQVLGLPRQTKLDVMISLGYPATGDIRTKNRKPPDETCQYL